MSKAFAEYKGMQYSAEEYANVFMYFYVTFTPQNNESSITQDIVVTFGWDDDTDVVHEKIADAIVSAGYDQGITLSPADVLFHGVVHGMNPAV